VHSTNVDTTGKIGKNLGPVCAAQAKEFAGSIKIRSSSDAQMRGRGRNNLGGLIKLTPIKSKHDGGIADDCL
jgi:hypothetical protein